MNIEDEILSGNIEEKTFGKNIEKIRIKTVRRFSGKNLVIYIMFLRRMIKNVKSLFFCEK